MYQTAVHTPHHIRLSDTQHTFDRFFGIMTGPQRRPCLGCRRTKKRRNGQQPICGACSQTGVEVSCSQPVETSTPTTTARKRRKVNNEKSPDRARPVLESQEAAAAEAVPTPSNALNALTSSPVLVSPEAAAGSGPASSTDRRSERSTLDIDMTTTAIEPIRVSYSTAMHLVQLFFDKIQPWMPIFHRPRFLKYCGRRLRPADGNRDSEEEEGNDEDDDVLQHLDLEERLLFLGIFSMSARFSNTDLFSSSSSEIAAPDRGDKFGHEAKRIYDIARDVVEPNLRYLQGCILLAFYYYTSGLSAQGWVIVGICARLGYALRLHEIDGHGDGDPDADAELNVGEDDPIELEGRRRAWWLVWELDCYGSTVLQRPFAIDQRRWTTRLPVSDEAWFSGQVGHADLLSCEPGQMWKSLIGMGTHDERACFLVANVLLSHVVDRGQRKKGHGVSLEEKISLEKDVSSAMLALPANFDLDAQQPLVYNVDSFARSNWIIGTHLLLAAAACLASGIPVQGQTSASASASANPNPMGFQYMLPESTSPGIGLGHSHILKLRSIILNWSPDYISLAHPFLAYSLAPVLGSELSSSMRASSTYPSCRDLATLVQLRFAERWKVGEIAHRIGKLMANPPDVLGEEDLSLVKRYPLYFSSLYTPRAARDHQDDGIFIGGADDQQHPSQTQTRPSQFAARRQQMPDLTLFASMPASAHDFRTDIFSDFDFTGSPANLYMAPQPVAGVIS